MQLFVALNRMNGNGTKDKNSFRGAVYHAMARGVDARDVFIDDEDRKTFVGVLARIERNTGAHILAYCLMGNHFHIAVKVGPVTLAAMTRYVQENTANTGKPDTFMKG